MIEAIFLFGGDIILIRIEGNLVKFAKNPAYVPLLATIEGLQLSRSGVEKDHPDLIDNPFWREESIKRFKEKIKSLDSEKKILEYIKNDLANHGYILKRYQIAGQREVKL